MSVLLPTLLHVALLGIEPVPAEPIGDVSQDVRRIFADERYHFCVTDTDYEPDSDDLRWCELAEAQQFRGCPGYQRVCQVNSLSLPEPAEAEGAPAQTGPGDGEGPGEAASEPEPEPEPLPDIGPLAKLLTWLLLIGLGLGVVIAIVRNLVRGRSHEPLDAPVSADPGASLVAARVEAMRVIETDVRRLLERAEQAAARGAHQDAIADVHAALLRRLEGEQLIAVDRWKTNGDFIAALRDKPSLRDELREVVRVVESVQFGAAPATADRYATIRAKVLAIVSRSSLALLLALGVTGQLACDETPPPASGTGPSGQRAIIELFERHELAVHRRPQGLAQLEQSHGAIALLSEVALDDEQWERVLAWVEAGGVLWVASGEPLPTQLGDYVPGPEIETELLYLGSAPAFVGLDCAAPPGRTLDPPIRAEVLLARPPENEWDAPDPYVVSVELGEGRVVVFAESDMLTNAALLVPDNAAFLIDLLRSAGLDELELVSAGDGGGAADPLESMRNAKLGALFLQVLLFLALLYAAVGIPFARLRDPPAHRRRSFAEHVGTLGQRYAQARAARHVAALYCGWALDRLRLRLQPGGARRLSELADAIATSTGRPHAQIMKILVEAHALREPDIQQRGGAAELELMRRVALLLDQTR